MGLPAVSYGRITEQQRDDILNYGFDPPANEVDPKQFSLELREVCERLQEHLSEIWQFGIGEGDCFIHTSSEQDRMLCVEIGNARIVNDELLGIAHRAVTDMAIDYCVDFCNDWFGLKLDSGDPYPDFNILVSKNQISIYSESDDLLQKLGVPQ